MLSAILSRPDLCCPHHGWKSSILSVAESLTHVSQVGHTTSMGSIQGIVVLFNAFGYFLLAVLNLGQLTASLQRHTQTQFSVCRIYCIHTILCGFALRKLLMEVLDLNALDFTLGHFISSASA